MSSASSEKKWTGAQQAAINRVGRNLLVSAAAGSGKTAVLAERLAYLVCDAPEEYRCDSDELLVMTFTNASAAEMRSRIASALRERLAQTRDANVERQLVLLDRAQIGTLDSFCRTLIKQHYDIAGVDPEFAMLSPEEADMLRAEVIKEQFDERYDADESGEFQQLVDDYGNGNDRLLRQQVLKAQQLLTSLVNPTEWIIVSQQRMVIESDARLVKTELGRSLFELVQRNLQDVRTDLLSVAERAQAELKLAKYVEDASELISIVEVWMSALGDGNFNQLSAAAQEHTLQRMPGITKLTESQQLISDDLKDVRKRLKPGSMLHQLCRFSEVEWKDGIARIAGPTRLFTSLVEDFDQRYRHAKDQARSLDFSDLSRIALRMLSSVGEVESPVARECRDKYRHVLVDEYQDVNEVQDRILQLIRRTGAQDSGTHAPNLFAVGDVKQSIYRFRLAEPKQFLAADKRYRSGTGHGEVIDLQTNFRSRPVLLSTLNRVFEKLMTPQFAELSYDDRHKLHPNTTSPYDQLPMPGASIEVHMIAKEAEAPTDSEETDDPVIEFDRTEREAEFIAGRIGSLLGRDGSPPMRIVAKSPNGMRARDIQAGDIAILLRSPRKKAQQFINVLRSHNIAGHTSHGAGFFESIEIRDMLSLLSVLDNQQQDVPLAALVRHPLLGVTNGCDTLARIRLWARKSNEPIPFHRALTEYAAAGSDASANELRNMLSRIKRWRSLIHRRPLAQAISDVLDECGAMTFYGALPDGGQRSANLLHLLERATQFDNFRRQGLGRFLEFLRILEEDMDIGQPAAVAQTHNAVRVMSIHASKGLEFPVVFVADLGKKHNTQDLNGNVLLSRELGVAFSVVDREKRVRYRSLPQVLVRERLSAQLLAEELRVLYVAMTRAKEKLILVGTGLHKTVDAWTQRFAKHAGPLSADYLSRCASPLDWIGSAAATISASSPDRVEVAKQDAPIASSRTEQIDDSRLRNVVGLRPVSPPVESTATSDRVWKRLAYEYPHEELTRRKASDSVTSIAKQSVAPDRFPNAIRERSPTKIDSLALGDATHIVLRHLDFGRPCDVDDLKNQLSTMVDRSLIPADVLPHIDVPALRWFVESDIGALVRSHKHRLRRELPIMYAHPIAPGSADGRDATMIRGRIDALLHLEHETIILDFKTDRLQAGEVTARAEVYRPQLIAYANAIQKIVKTPLVRSVLVFLTAREAVEI